MTSLLVHLCSMLHDYWMLVSHLLPAYAADLGFMLMGKKPRYVEALPPHFLVSNMGGIR